MNVRKPHVAGQFYPASPGALIRQLKMLIEERKEKEDAYGLVCPHAGYIYSGKVTAECFSSVKLTQTVIILGPNHSGLGSPFSIMTEGYWQMPMGTIEIDIPLAKKILDKSKYLKEDSEAHSHEHSIEVQLPFLQFFMSKIKIIPIVISHADIIVYDEIGKAIAQSLQEVGKHCLIVASSDMTHYEPYQEAQKKDNLAIQAILTLDEKELLKCIAQFNITMCGFGPVVCMLSASKKLGAKQARLIKYQTSGDISKDYFSVVGYAGIIVQ
jgi:hypothetical protein